MNKIFKVLTFIFIYLLSIKTFSKECDISKLSGRELDILSQILHNKDRANEPIEFEYALKLSKLFIKAAKKYKVSASDLAAIGFIESNYTSQEGKIHKPDKGIMQINIKAHPNYDAKRLLNDLEYNINVGAEILSKHLKIYYKNNLKNGIKSYNCGLKRSCLQWPHVKHYWRKFLKAKQHVIYLTHLPKRFCK